MDANAGSGVESGAGGTDGRAYALAADVVPDLISGTQLFWFIADTPAVIAETIVNGACDTGAGCAEAEGVVPAVSCRAVEYCKASGIALACE